MLTQSEIDAIKAKAEIHVEWNFNGGVSPTTEKNCLESYIAGATEERQRANVLLDEKDKEINDLKDFISQMQHLLNQLVG